MSRRPDNPQSDPSSSDRSSSVVEDWTELRTLLLAPEQTQLDELRDRLDGQVVQARDVGRVLPEAFAVRGDHDEPLSTVLAPYVESGFVTAVRKSPRTIVDAIAPIMGPAIRQAIARALQSMTQSFNRSLDESLSVRSLRWRVDAWRTGRSFAEVVLLHTLRYRVEQVFLIHRETGLLLHHVATDAAVVQDEHVLSGMLTAIQNYARDSFGASQDQTLDQFQVGDWTVWVEQGSQAYLAAVIRGTPPTSLREDFRDVLDHIHAKHTDTLARFKGDAAPFKTTQTQLETCLQAHYETPRPDPLKAWILVGLLLLGAIWLGWTTYQNQTRWSMLLTELKATPGLVVTAAKSTWGAYYLEGLRDPLAKDPSELVAEAGFDPTVVKAVWSPYYALNPELVLVRAETMLHPPDTVKLTMEGDTLVATGSASETWVGETRRFAALIPGVSRYRDEKLLTHSVAELLDRINQTVVRFGPGVSTVGPSEQRVLGIVGVALRSLDEAAAHTGQRVVLEVLGSTDSTGPAARNAQLRKERAETVLASIGQHHIGEHTTVITDIVRSAASNGSQTEVGSRRIVTLRAFLTTAGAENETARP